MGTLPIPENTVMNESEPALIEFWKGEATK